MVKNILICGASGLVGQAVIKEIIDSYKISAENGAYEENKVDYEIFAASSHPEAIDIQDKRLHKISNDQVETIFKSCPIDVLLQLAFPRNVSADQWASGIKFASNILFLAKKHNVRKVINISSQSVYGWQREKPAHEQFEICLNSPYTTGKYCLELIAEQLFDEGMYTNIRLSTVIGPTTEERVVNKFLANIVGGKDINVQGGMQIFSFLDIRDAAQGLFTLVKNDEKCWRHVYNLGTAESETLLEIAQIAIEIGQKNGFNQSDLVVKPADVVLNNQLDVFSFQRDFCWKATYNLYDSMEYIFAENYGLQM